MEKWTCTRCGLIVESEEKPEEKSGQHRHTWLSEYDEVEYDPYIPGQVPRVGKKVKLRGVKP